MPAPLLPHRTVTLLSIGDELALGQTLDTNSMWLADRLWTLGVRTLEHATVDDDEPRIAAAMERLGAVSDLLIVTGGLGPTADDLTRFALARVLGDGKTVDLVEDAASMESLRAWFATRPGGMPEANGVQAMRPAGSVCLANPQGTAPGLFARVERLGCDVFCVPGPPREMKPMVEAEVVPRLRVDAGRVSRVRLLLTFGLGESAVAERLGSLMDRDRAARGAVLVGTTASRGVVTCRLRHDAVSVDAVESALDSAEADVRSRLGASVFDRRDPAHGDAMEIADALPRAVLGLLRERRETVAVAESCTGGMLGALLTEVPGSSDVFYGGFQTYQNEAKAAMLGVPMALIAEHGAVSGAVVMAMSRGVLDRTPATHALAISGVAGPGGGTEAKPVGTVWIAMASRDGTVDARRFVFKGGREAIREWSARAAMGMLRLALIGEAMPLLGQAEPTPS